MLQYALHTLDMKERMCAYRIGRSRTGLGLFALSAIQEGTDIVEYTGERIPTAVADARATKYLFEVDDAWTIDGSGRSNMARYINHSCEPNAEAELDGDNRIFIVAKRTIAPGEEITFDYGDEYFNEFIRPLGCKCPACAARSAAVCG